MQCTCCCAPPACKSLDGCQCCLPYSCENFLQDFQLLSNLLAHHNPVCLLSSLPQDLSAAVKTVERMLESICQAQQGCFPESCQSCCLRELQTRQYQLMEQESTKQASNQSVKHSVDPITYLIKQPLAHSLTQSCIH